MNGAGHAVGGDGAAQAVLLQRRPLLGRHSSTEGQPSSLATWQIFSSAHFSPAELKHQKAMDCLMRPLTTAFFSSVRASPATEATAPAASVSQQVKGLHGVSSKWLGTKISHEEHKKTRKRKDGSQCHCLPSFSFVLLCFFWLLGSTSFRKTSHWPMPMLTTTVTFAG